MKKLFKSLFLILIYGALVFAAIVGIKALYEKINFQFCEKCEYVEEVIIEPTCLEKGILRKTCKVCGHYEEEELNVVAHDYDSSEIVNATCVTDGYNKYTCKICGVEYTDLLKAYGHSLLDPSHAELIYEAKNCEEQNIYKIICLNENCNYYEEYKGRYGECDYDLNYSQNIHYFECNSCGDRYGEEEHILAEMNKGTIVHQAENCLDTTTINVPCVCNCGYYKVFTKNDGQCVYELKHNDEKSWQECKYCGDVIDESSSVFVNVIEDYTAWNCSEKSYKVYSCSCSSECGYIKTIYSGSGDCVFNVVKNDDGKFYTCKYCGYETTDKDEVEKMTGLIYWSKFTDSSYGDIMIDNSVEETSGEFIIYVNFIEDKGEIYLVYEGTILTKDNVNWINNTILVFDLNVNNYTLYNNSSFDNGSYGSYIITFNPETKTVTVNYAE